MKIKVITFTIFSFILGCKQEHKPDTFENKKQEETKTNFFSLVDPEKSGFYFVNEVKETEKLNVFSYEYIYNGSGVALGDINNDGLCDIFMGGNLFGGRLFLNEGGLKFKQISDSAGVFSGGYTTGVTMADVNADGWLDIYLCKSLSNDSNQRSNVLLINNHNNTFTDKAKEFGLNDKGFSQQASFFDYDNDGDLDMYLINHRIDFQNALTLNYSKFRPDSLKKYSSDKLYRNNGDNSFSDVTKSSGITNSSFGLGISISDVNNDGWKDIYVNCDYSDKDHLYINQRNGTFIDKIDEQLFHISRNSMGSDFADINNDGYQDLITLDMMAEDNYRQKQLKGQSPYDLFQLANQNGLHYQVMRNCLQLNNGNGTFSEIAQLSGVSHTDWSWAPLFADFDNDGMKDLFITNGYYRDVTDMDYIKYASNQSVIADGGIAKVNKFKLLETMKQTPIQNYIYKNNGDLTFSDKSLDWGITKASFSNGTAYGDLDNDGDLDLVVNNFNAPSFLYENKSEEIAPKNYINILLDGGKNNPYGIGAKVWIIIENSIQTQEMSLSRGFISSVEPKLHFGLGKAKTINKICVLWENGKMESLTNIACNQSITLSKKNAKEEFKSPYQTSSPVLFSQISESLCNFKHKENDFNDFKYQPLLEQMYSNDGPCFTIGDINGDKIEDFFVGGSAGVPGAFYVQQAGKFKKIKCSDIDDDAKFEDTGCLLFDIDNDNDLDLYVASGSNEVYKKELLQDRIYINDGKGNFKLDQTRIPSIESNSTCIDTIDFDNDGDMDLFIGGGVIAGSYPESYQCVLLENNNGFFKNASSKLPNSGKLGIVTCVKSENIIQSSSTKELIISGHWMGIKILNYKNGRFSEDSQSGNLEKQKGWWNCITAADFDNDGDIDFVCGNRGLNSFYKASDTYPATLLSNDFDNNGSIDPVACYYFKDNKLYPKYTMDELFAQVPLVRKKFTTYTGYSTATANDIFSEKDYKNTVVSTVSNFASSYFENLGNGEFKVSSLPNLSQLSIVRSILSLDINNDGYKDIITIGNQYAADVEMGRYDASISSVLVNNKKGGFNVLNPVQSGLKIIGDSRKIDLIYINKKPVIIVSINNSGLSFFNIIRNKE